jgi:hypothetical protein
VAELHNVVDDPALQGLVDEGAKLVRKQFPVKP